MTSGDNKVTDKQSKPQIKEAAGVRGWLLRKAKTFMWDANTNTLILPKGVVLSVEEKAELEAMFGKICDMAEKVRAEMAQQQVAMQQAGVKYYANVVRGYDLLVNGSYRELTGVLAHKVSANLQGMLMINRRFVSGVWKVLVGAAKEEKPKDKTMMTKKDRGGR